MSSPGARLGSDTMTAVGLWDSGRTVGVLGGLGPMATALFLQLVVDRTDVATDQAHLDLVVSQHSSTPDRTAYILDRSKPDPQPALVADARMLERLGVSVLALPCNTAHFFVHAVEAAVQVPVLSIVSHTVAEAVARFPQATRFGVLATDGTMAARVYQDALAAAGREAVLPTEADQALVMGLIYDEVKAGLPASTDVFEGVISRVLGAGATAVLLGCTELSVIAIQHDLLMRPEIVDSLDALAVATVRWAGRPVRDRYC